MTAVAERSTALTEAGRETSKQLTEAEAIELSAQIRVKVEDLLPLIRTAYQRRADLALGYDSWEAYCDGEFSGLRMSVADRREAVAGLRADGMSQRAIATALRTTQSTVRDDLQVSGIHSPEKVTGRDGREQKAAHSAPEPPADLRAEVLTKLPPADSDGITVIKLYRSIPGSTTAAVRDILDELVEDDEAECIRSGEHAGRYRLPTPPPTVEPEAVLSAVGSYGINGANAWQVAFNIHNANPALVRDRVVVLLHELAGAERIVVVGQDNGPRWALAKFAPTQAPESSVVDSPTVPAGGSGPGPSGASSPAPEQVGTDSPPGAKSEAAEKLRADMVRESERRTAIASIRSVLTYLTSRVLEPAQLAQDYLIALDEFSAVDLRFAAKTMAALADLKEQ